MYLERPCPKCKRVATETNQRFERRIVYACGNNKCRYEFYVAFDKHYPVTQYTLVDIVDMPEEYIQAYLAIAASGNKDIVMIIPLSSGKIHNWEGMAETAAEITGLLEVSFHENIYAMYLSSAYIFGKAKSADYDRLKNMLADAGSEFVITTMKLSQARIENDLVDVGLDLPQVIFSSLNPSAIRFGFIVEYPVVTNEICIENIIDQYIRMNKPE